MQDRQGLDDNHETKYPLHIMRKLRSVIGDDEDDIRADSNIALLSKREVLDTLLMYDGILGYTTKIINYVSAAYGIDLEKQENEL